MSNIIQPNVQRRDSEYIRERMPSMELAGRRKRERPQRRSMDVPREEIQMGVTKQDRWK